MKAEVLAIEKRESKLLDYLTLVKFKLSMTTTITAFFSYLLVTTEVGWELVIAVVGIGLLACGVSALNQLQERHLDALMPRTATRPLVTGRLSVQEAIVCIVSLIATAMVLGYLVLGWFGVAMYGFVVLLYNGIYVYQKRYNAYAVFPGSLLGVIPPMIGWLVAGGSLSDTRFMALAFFYFIWQVPHFWLLVLVYHEDYKKAGMPTMVEVVGAESLGRLTFITTGITLLSAILVAMVFAPQSLFINIAIAASFLMLLLSMKEMLKHRWFLHRKQIFRVFIRLNLFTVGFIVLVILGQL